MEDWWVTHCQPSLPAGLLFEDKMEAWRMFSATLDRHRGEKGGDKEVNKRRRPWVLGLVGWPV